MPNQNANILWISASPSLNAFDVPLLKALSRDYPVYQWEYHQELDEPVSIDQTVALLYDYLSPSQGHRREGVPVHLMGHGISGVVGLLFARRFPELIQSLTLLSVAERPATTWHSHYYIQRHLLEGSRSMILQATMQNIFGNSPPFSCQELVRALGYDLEKSPCPHSIFKTVRLPQGGVDIPLFVCGSQTDTIVGPNALYDWYDWLNPCDALWLCPEGRHFFHYYYPEETRHAMGTFLKKVERNLGNKARNTSVPLVSVSDQ